MLRTRQVPVGPRDASGGRTAVVAAGASSGLLLIAFVVYAIVGGLIVGLIRRAALAADPAV